MKHSIYCSVIKKSGILTVLFLLSTAIQLRAQPDTAGIPPQFLFSRFDSGLVKLKTGVTFNAVINYNTLTEKMTFYKDAMLMDLNKPETVDTILLQNTKFVFIDNAFYEVLLNAPVSVFIQHKADLKSTGRPAALGTTSQTIGSTSVSKLVGENHTYNLKLPENFKVSQFPVYWVRLDYKLHRFLTIRQFLNIFPSKEDEIKEFINKNNLKINRPADLIKLGQYCNELTR
jgi:hypothetical protein